MISQADTRGQRSRRVSSRRCAHDVRTTDCATGWSPDMRTDLTDVEPSQRLIHAREAAVGIGRSVEVGPIAQRIHGRRNHMDHRPAVEVGCAEWSIASGGHESVWIRSECRRSRPCPAAGERPHVCDRTRIVDDARVSRGLHGEGLPHLLLSEVDCDDSIEFMFE